MLCWRFFYAAQDAVKRRYFCLDSLTPKTGQQLQCTCAKCRIALFLARVTCSRSYGYYILYIGVIGRLTKMLEIEIVITMGMQFWVRIWGILKCNLQEVRHKVWVGGEKLKIPLLGPLIVSIDS